MGSKITLRPFASTRVLAPLTSSVHAPVAGLLAIAGSTGVWPRPWAWLGLGRLDLYDHSFDLVVDELRQRSGDRADLCLKLGIERQRPCNDEHVLVDRRVDLYVLGPRKRRWRSVRCRPDSLRNARPESGERGVYLSRPKPPRHHEHCIPRRVIG